MALTIQICAVCKHESDTHPAIKVDGQVYNILCPCTCHTKVALW